MEKRRNSDAFGHAAVAMLVLAAICTSVQPVLQSQVTADHSYAAHSSSIVVDYTMQASSPTKRAEAERQRRMRVEQQKQIAANLARLLRLTSDLKLATDDSNEGNYPAAVLAEAAEIEKLAHKVREASKGSAGN